MFALQAQDDAGIQPRVLLGVWFVQQQGSVPQQQQVLVQFSTTLPQVSAVSAFCVVSHDYCGLSGRGEAPGQGEILHNVRGNTWDGQPMTLLLEYGI